MFVTLDQILERASQAGFGEPAKLRQRFIGHQKRGLVGMAEHKANRQGGEGLWHPIQAELWMAVLRHQDQGVKQITLANFPVGLWMLGYPIPVTQAQRAMRFWILNKVPTGPRSLQRRAVDAQVDRLAHPHATPASKREVRELFERMQADRAVNYSSDTSARLMQEIIAPTADHLDQFQRGTLQAISTQARLQFLALEHLDVLTQERETTWAVWEWARTTHQRGLSEYERLAPEMRKAPETGHLWDDPTLTSILNAACSTTLLLLGAAISENPGGLAELSGSPPALPAIHRKAKPT